MLCEASFTQIPYQYCSVSTFGGLPHVLFSCHWVSTFVNLGKSSQPIHLAFTSFVYFFSQEAKTWRLLGSFRTPGMNSCLCLLGIPYLDACFWSSDNCRTSFHAAYIYKGECFLQYSNWAALELNIWLINIFLLSIWEKYFKSIRNSKPFWLHSVTGLTVDGDIYGLNIGANIIDSCAFIRPSSLSANRGYFQILVFWCQISCEK